VTALSVVFKSHHQNADKACRVLPPLAVDPELVEPFTVALNTDDAIPELWFDVLLPQLARLDNMTVGVDYASHRA